MRPTTTTRARTAIARHEHLAAPTVARRVTLVVLGLACVVAEVLLGLPALAWPLVLVVAVAGLAGSARESTAIALVLAAARLTLAIPMGSPWRGLVLEVVARTATLVVVGLLAAATHELEAERRRAIARAANEDAVTGLLNVRTFYDALGDLHRGGHDYTILLADIRGMRPLNETYGHPTGTEAIRIVAQVLRRAIDGDVLASRLGSDEVAIALTDADEDRATDLVADVTARLAAERLPLPDGGRAEVHVAFGLARRHDADGVIAVLSAADRARRHAKTLGLDAAVWAKDLATG
jgi:diguanylate cyclase (GGDEF)-like protein